jgi:hypothetical protein
MYIEKAFIARRVRVAVGAEATGRALEALVVSQLGMHPETDAAHLCDILHGATRKLARLVYKVRSDALCVLLAVSVHGFVAAICCVSKARSRTTR